MNKKLIFGGILISLLSIGVGIVIGYFAIQKSNDSSNTEYQYARLTQAANEKNYKDYISAIQANNIRENLRNLTKTAHLAGLPEDLDSANVIEARWKQDGLLVYKPRYDVLLSYPDDNIVNRVTLRDASGNITLETNGTEKVYDPTQAATVKPFLAYTPNGTVTSTRLYYANYGQLEDLQALASKVGSENLRGSIIIIRYGAIFRGDKIMHAQQFGAIGAILYNDPADYAPFGISPNQTYNQTWFMPPSGTQRGSAYTSDGDPLTPFYPSTDYMFRINEESVKFLPKIPAQPIGYAEAQVLLQNTGGDPVEAGWRGFLPNVTYRYGGNLTNGGTVEVKSFNRRERKYTYDVIGIMKGDVEPDRYIVFGNHRDAWSLGAMDPTSGTATLLEMTRALGEMYRNGFRPRRSLMFCSWGAEEYGLMGSIEYAQEYVKFLGARIVSYLNVDIAVQGNHTVRVSTSPLLFDAIVNASKMVPSAYDSADKTVFDKWMEVYVNPTTGEPDFGIGLGSGSDYLGFDQLVGSSNADLRYTYDYIAQGNVDSYPLYHTSYEVFSMMEKFVDPNFTAHRTLAQLWGTLGLALSENPILPLNVTRYKNALLSSVNSLRPANVSLLQPLKDAVNDFGKAAEQFVQRSQSMDRSNPYVIRFYNDQLLQLERAFLNPLGQGGDEADLKHIVYAPSKNNQYAAEGFPAISDAIADGNSTEIYKQVAIATYFVRGALATLKEFDNFFA